MDESFFSQIYLRSEYRLNRMCKFYSIKQQFVTLSVQVISGYVDSAGPSGVHDGHAIALIAVHDGVVPASFATLRDVRRDGVADGQYRTTRWWFGLRRIRTGSAGSRTCDAVSCASSAFSW